LFLFFSRSISS